MQFNLPESWEEVPPNLLPFICQALISCEEDDEARDIILFKLLKKLSKRDYNLLSIGQKYDLLTCIDWMSMIGLRSQLFLSFKPSWSLPQSQFKDGTCFEFAKADFYFKRFQESQDVKDLDLFFAVLARHKNQPIDGDNADKELKWKVKKLRKVPTYIKIVTLAYFAGIKSLIHELYGEYLFDSPIANAEGYQAKIKLEWWGLFFSVAETGVFGDIHGVHAYNLHDVCAFLCKKKEEHLAQMLKK